jgi:hypothetical protein
MTETQQQERRAECQVAAEDQVVAFVHNLGGPVVITAYDGDDQVGYIADVEITPNEVEVVVVPGTVTRLVAVPRPPDGEG